MVETRNWLEMPHEIMGGMILQRLSALEILINAQKVCTTWRRICKDPAMWKIIHLHYSVQYSIQFPYTENDFEKLSMQAVHRSCGELIDISIDFFVTDNLLDYISRCSSKLYRLCLRGCYSITICGLNNALKRLPLLETLELSDISICAKDIEVIGCNCPRLKSFKIKKSVMHPFDDGNSNAHAIANSMPLLRHLQLISDIMAGDDGIRAILNGCPHLESLDICGYFYIPLDSNLEELCRERIKDFNYKCYNIPKGCEEFDMDDYY